MFASKYAIVPPQVQVEPQKAKSGYTPRSPLHPATILASTSRRDARNAIENFQKEQLRGFTTEELIELDAITNRGLKPSSLNTPIHPLLDRDRWDAKPYIVYPVEGGNGNWDASNDQVWATMKPILRLASLFSIDLLKHPWVR
jgi:hypothetical protein